MRNKCGSPPRVVTLEQFISSDFQVSLLMVEYVIIIKTRPQCASDPDRFQTHVLWFKALFGFHCVFTAKVKKNHNQNTTKHRQQKYNKIKRRMQMLNRIPSTDRRVTVFNYPKGERRIHRLLNLGPSSFPLLLYRPVWFHTISFWTPALEIPLTKNVNENIKSGYLSFVSGQFIP